MVKRGTVETSIDAVNLTPLGGDIKKKGAWRYPGGIIQRGEHLNMKRDDGSFKYRDHIDTDMARRKIESNFFITLSTNRQLTGAALAAGKAAMSATLNYLREDKALCAYLKFGPKHFETYGKDVYADVIQKVEWKSAVEVGENLGRLHCHIWLTVHHYSQIQVNMPVLQNMCKAEYNKHAKGPFEQAIKQRGRPYISVKLLPTTDWAMVMRQYILKGMGADNPGDFLGVD